MTLVIGGALRDVRPWQCIPLPFGKDCAHTVFVSSMFTLPVTEVDSQSDVISHYEQTPRLEMFVQGLQTQVTHGMYIP